MLYLRAPRIPTDRLRARELCESRRGRPGLPVPEGSPYGLRGRKATLNSNPTDTHLLTLLTLLTAAKTFSGKAVAETYVRIKRDQTFTEKRQGCDRDLVAYTETKHLVPSDKAVTERPGRMQTWPNP